MNVSYLCLGGNIGNREKNLSDALLFIEQEAGEIIQRSAVYETEAWGVDQQPAYLNCCIKLQTLHSAAELMSKLLSIEKKLGRSRNGEQYSSRTVDIDILFFNNDVIDANDLIIPHPRLHLRKFVLIPLYELAATYIHPIFNESVHSLLLKCADDSLVKLHINV